MNITRRKFLSAEKMDSLDDSLRRYYKVFLKYRNTRVTKELLRNKKEPKLVNNKKSKRFKKIAKNAVKLKFSKNKKINQNGALEEVSDKKITPKTNLKSAVKKVAKTKIKLTIKNHVSLRERNQASRQKFSAIRHKIFLTHLKYTTGMLIKASARRARRAKAQTYKEVLDAPTYVRPNSIYLQRESKTKNKGQLTLSSVKIKKLNVHTSKIKAKKLFVRASTKKLKSRNKRANKKILAFDQKKTRRLFKRFAAKRKNRKSKATRFLQGSTVYTSPAHHHITRYNRTARGQLLKRNLRKKFRKLPPVKQ